jgi:hypothetical protein
VNDRHEPTASAADGGDWLLGTDGRDLDSDRADLSGAASTQIAAQRPDRPTPGAARPVWDGIPSDQPRDDAVTYFGQPVVKAAPWGRPV